ncbi:DUF3180 domain-containing protein [Luteococcus sp. Sow4_B9]|uniref:DUF3180 domain-containing protein n=1 Tax=Luteococcus sp. Sow4_B9 TaxID=3438792 RepID=UPI003F9DE43B
MSSAFPSGPEDPQPGDLQPTTNRQITTSVLAGMVVGWFVVGTIQALGNAVPVVPWSLPLVLGALGIAALAYAEVLRRQVERTRADISPEAGVRALVLGKTMLMTGAIMAGGHLVYVLANLGSWEIPAPRMRVVRGLWTIAASAIFGWAGHRLERACLVPGDDVDPDDPDPGAPDAGSRKAGPVAPDEGQLDH